uniref:Protein MEMO1 n=1 Tax=Rhizophora mucronata TaxID=61149 RepID=A0A2P2KCW9_RHIMU
MLFEDGFMFRMDSRCFILMYLLQTKAICSTCLSLPTRLLQFSFFFKEWGFGISVKVLQVPRYIICHVLTCNFLL